MKVLFLNPAGELGGAERSLLDVMASLRAMAPDAKIALLAGSPGPMLDAAERLGVSVHLLPLPDRLAELGDSNLATASPFARLRFAARGSDLVAYAARFAKLVRSLSPDVMHSNGLKMHLVSAAFRPRSIPLVWHIRDFLGARPVSARLVRVASRRAHLAIANSHAVGEDVRALAPGLEVRVMHNAIDTDIFSPEGPIAPLDALSIDGRPPSRVAPLGQRVLRIGLIGAYARWKGHDVFLDAAAKLSERTDLPPLRFYVVGSPIYATGSSGQYSVEELREMAVARGLTNVVFVPFQRDPADTYRALDIVVHASTRPEPFGRIIVEAMASGRPAVVSQAGGAVELFDEGIDALGVPPGNASRMADAIGRLAVDESLRRAIGSAARRTATIRFSRERLGAELLAIYSDLFTRLRLGDGSEKSAFEA